MIGVKSNMYEIVDKPDFSNYSFYEKISTPLHDRVLNILGSF